MRLDVLTIFPEYLAPLDLSLIGKARRDGLLDVQVRDLREFTHDRHRTVDDTPYGGGAGMVMKPEPWGEALDDVLARAGTAGTRPRLIVPGPGGTPFTQAAAHRLAAEDHLVFACGRYEGIDERVYEEARERFEGRVEIVSLGDYVLNGGEVAVLAMIEAIARLLPGVVGNAESLVEESHEDGLLEYPVYTKPATWRDRAVPDVLLGGNHGAIAAWRHEQRLARTAARRPDLLPTSAVMTGSAELPIRPATPADAAELFVLQRACWFDEGTRAGDYTIPPLVETVEDVRASLAPDSPWRTWVVRDDAGRLIASVRGRLAAIGDDAEPATWEVARLMVAPDLAGRGIGRTLLAHVVSQADPDARRAWLVTGANSARNQRIYRKAGFRVLRGTPTHPGTVEMALRLS
ncbi:MAG: tRNA (guanosine(37)-N1)-methyltransferase TrmD [Mobilicoccus sp.]|nr:tRNA (guanosine(37)-N1)-methyltransferase TrmD [Mobilicoccus sp.]